MKLISAFTAKLSPTPSRVVLWLAWVWFIASIATWFALTRYSEQSLLLSMLLYGPRIVVLAPLVILVPLVLWAWRKSVRTATKRNRRNALRNTVLPLVLATLVNLFGVMGLRFAPVTLFSTGLTIPRANDSQLRVITLNSQGGDAVASQMNELIVRYEPSVMAFQECGKNLAATLQNLSREEWYFDQHRSLCIISKWPITARDTMPRGAFARIARLGFGGSALVVAYDIEHPVQPFTVVNLHLETPRKGLSGILGSGGIINDETGLPDVNIRGNTQRFALNAEIRMRESARAADWTAHRSQTKPVIVTGDFNMPVESSIYRAYWSDFINAFNKSGNGFGFSKHEGRLLRIRIDHILLSRGWFKVHGSWVGSDVGSDHRPMIADVELLQH